MVQDSDFVRWSSVFHHVIVFTVRKKDVSCSFIFFRYTLQMEIFLCKKHISFPTLIYKAQFGLTIKIYSVWTFILNESDIWLVYKESQITQMHCRISPRKMFNPCDFTMLINCKYHRLLNNDVKRNSKIEVWVPLMLV